MAEIDTSELNEALGELTKDEARDIANRWFSRSQEILFQGGDEAGYEVQNVAQSGVPPQFDGEVWRFGYRHIAAPFFEFGTDAHTITPTNAEFLRFEWPDAPQEIRERFSETFPVVFFREVEVEGIESLRYVRDSRDEIAGQAARGDVPG